MAVFFQLVTQRALADPEKFGGASGPLIAKLNCRLYVIGLKRQASPDLLGG